MRSAFSDVYPCLIPAHEQDVEWYFLKLSGLLAGVCQHDCRAIHGASRNPGLTHNLPRNTDRHDGVHKKGIGALDVSVNGVKRWL